MSIQGKMDTKLAVDGLLQFASRLPEATHVGLQDGAKDGFNDSQRLVHVRTGFLKASGGIKEDTAEKVVYGYDARYASEENDGNSRRPPHPFITPRYNVLKDGLAADYVYRRVITIL